MIQRKWRGSVLVSALAALVVGCASPPSAPDPSGTAPGSLATPAITPVPISVTEVKYGLLSVRTVPGARCQANLRIASGYYGDAPPGTLPGQNADPNGFVSWAYPTPRVPSGTASYTIACQGEAASETKGGSFSIPTRPIYPTSFTVRVTTDQPPQETFDPDPSLVPLRDASAAKMSATLAAEWKTATRGLGSLEVVTSSADMTIFVVASKSQSHWVQSGDDSQQIVVFVSGEIGPRNVENNVAVALHELGHIWCCRGPGTSDGHWVTKEPSPGLYGVDKYGLMTDPVTCVSFGSVLSCPNRFSDREMVALGFTSFPPPAPDPCVTQWLSVRSQLNTVNGQITDLRNQIVAIETQYPRGIPPSIYPSYVALVDQHNALVRTQNGLVAQSNSLPCDAS